MKTREFLQSLTKNYRSKYVGAITAIALATLFSLIAPLVIRYTIDNLIGGGNQHFPGQKYLIDKGIISYAKENLWISGLILMSLTLLQGVFTFLKGRWSAEVSENLAKRLKERLYDHLQRLPFSYHTKAETGDLIQRCTSDVDTIRSFLGMQLIEVGRTVIMLAGVIPIMLMLDVKMTLISMGVIPVIFVFALIFFIKIKSAFKESDETEGELSTVLQENLTGVRVVRAFNRQEFELNKFDVKNKAYRDKTYYLILLLAYYWSLSDLLCFIQIAGVLIYGAVRASAGTLTIGTLVVFMSYERSLLWPVRQMGRILTDMGKASVSLKRILEVMNVKPEKYSEPNFSAQSTRFQGKLVFDNVCFNYGNDISTLKNISFEVNPGEMVAIVGPTGSGKSTLISLIPRLYDYSSGSIKLDDFELNTISKSWLRKQVGIVLQEPFLFSKTLKENIRLGNAIAEDEDIYESSGVANIHETILGFEQGYETIVGERGVTLSGGQKQRVAIARALVQNPGILIFDDSLSAVDTETDAKIRKALLRRKGKTTTFIISHRITTISQADKIIVLENGEITQVGNHASLMKQEGLYRRIWNIQNVLEEDIRHEMDLENFEKFNELNEMEKESCAVTE